MHIDAIEFEIKVNCDNKELVIVLLMVHNCVCNILKIISIE